MTTYEFPSGISVYDVTTDSFVTGDQMAKIQDSLKPSPREVREYLGGFEAWHEPLLYNEDPNEAEDFYDSISIALLLDVPREQWDSFLMASVYGVDILSAVPDGLL